MDQLRCDGSARGRTGTLGLPDQKPPGWFDDSSRNSYHFGVKTRASEKGQVTIPKQLRDRLGIRPGQSLEIREEGGRLVATKSVGEDPVARVYGILKLGRSTDRALEELRGKPQPK